MIQDDILAVIHGDKSAWMPILKFGAGSAGVGFLIGSTTGILRGTSPGISGLASSIQCAAIGTTFYATRSGLLQAWDQEQQSSATLTKASVIAGAVSGGAAGLVFRGPRNVVPGMICIAGMAGVGQAFINTRQENSADKTGLWQRLTKNIWSPVTSISNEDYRKLLEEKLLKVEVEIAILDDKIALLRQEVARTTKQAQQTDVKK